MYIDIGELENVIDKYVKKKSFSHAVKTEIMELVNNLNKYGDSLNIKELRTACSMTQQSFADYLHIPKRTIENWESAISAPPQYVIELIEYKLRNEGLI